MVSTSSRADPRLPCPPAATPPAPPGPAAHHDEVAGSDHQAKLPSRLPPIRIVVADDHALVRVGLAALIGGATDLTVVGQAADGEHAVRLAIDLAPDVVLMDLRMPVLDGVNATRMVRAQRPETSVLILTAFPDRRAIEAALRAGAAGWLLKDVGPQRLVAAVRRAARSQLT